MFRPGNLAPRFASESAGAARSSTFRHIRHNALVFASSRYSADRLSRSRCRRCRPRWDGEPPIGRSFYFQTSLQTCRDLYHAAQDRHVWVDHLDNLRQKNPVLKPATPPLTSLSAQELKGFIAGWINLRFRWEKDHTNFGFTKKGVVGIPGPCCLFLLPGGKTLLTIDDRGGLALRRIEMVDGRVSLPSVATIESDKVLVFKPGRNKLITTTSPSPILVRGQSDFPLPPHPPSLTIIPQRI